MHNRCFDFVARMMAAAAASKEYVLQKIAEAQLSGGEVDLSAYAPRSEVKSLISLVSTAADTAQKAADEAQSTADAAQDAANANGLEIEALQADVDEMKQTQSQLGTAMVTVTLNTDYVTAWNAFHNFRDGNTLHINGNLRISADIPGGAVLFTLPCEVRWAYMLIKHGDNLFFSIANGNTVCIPNSAEMLKSTGSNATIMGSARIVGTAATTE